MEYNFTSVGPVSSRYEITPDFLIIKSAGRSRKVSWNSIKAAGLVRGREEHSGKSPMSAHNPIQRFASHFQSSQMLVLAVGKDLSEKKRALVLFIPKSGEERVQFLKEFNRHLRGSWFGEQYNYKELTKALNVSNISGKACCSCFVFVLLLVVGLSALSVFNANFLSKWLGMV